MSIAVANFESVVRRRRMCRSFERDPVSSREVDRMIDLARRAPSAGFTQGLTFVVLERGTVGGDPVAEYWNVTLPEERRASFPWPGLLDAPVLITVWVRPAAWVERYGSSDKRASGLGAGEAAWPVPYWWVDAGAAVENLLLVAEASGMGALFFGMFEHEDVVRTALDVPQDWRGVGTVALGRAAAGGRRPSGSTVSGRPPLAEQLHRGHWHG